MLNSRPTVVALAQKSCGLAAVLFITTAMFLTIMSSSPHAEDAGVKENSGKHNRKLKKPQSETAEPSAASSNAQPAPATIPQVPASPSRAQVIPASDIAAQLREGGAGACAAEVDAMAGNLMAGVQQFNTASSWAATRGGNRIVSLSIGQKYSDVTPTRYGTTSVLAAPNGQGSCDAVSVHVSPSSLSCEKIRDALLPNGKQIGDLAGVLLMQDPHGQSMLVPAPAGTCVVVGLNAAYAK